MKFRLLIISTAVIAFFSTCETDIDITGDYQKTPVIYGLLDLNADTQFVLINRTFLGSGNALEAALVEDSMLYTEVEAKIRFINLNGGDDFVNLTKTTRCGKSTLGAFFSPCYTVYYVPSAELWPEYNSWASSGVFDVDDYKNIDYRLDILADGNEIKATTRLASARGGSGNGAISIPNSNPANDVDFVSIFSQGNSTYLANGLRVKWGGLNSVNNAIKHEVRIRFNYKEVMMDGSSANRSVEFPFATKEQSQANSSEVFDVSEPGSIFFQNLASRIEPDPNVRYREIGKIDYILKVAGVDFTTYLNIGDPVSSVGQSRPTYSNINEGEGVGLFSSRDKYVLAKDLYVNIDEDLKEMVNGVFTQGLCFCDPTGSFVDYSCDNPVTNCQ